MALIGWENAVGAAGVQLGASAEAAGYPVQMLAVPQGAPSVAWQTPSGTRDAFLTIYSPVPIAWRLAALCRTNLTTAARMRVRVGALATVISGPVYDSGLISAGVQAGIGQALHIMPSAVTADTMNIYFDDFANPETALNIPLAYAGPATQFAIAPQSQPSLDVRRQDVTTRGGQVFTDALSRARTWAVNVGFIRDSATDFLDNLEAASAAGSNVLFVPRESSPRASAESIFGLLTPGPRGFLGPTGLYRTWSANMIERL